MIERPYYGVCNYQGAGIYRHYKGGLYEVLGLSVDEATVDKLDTTRLDELNGRIMVIYRPLSPGSLLPKLTPMNERMGSAAVTMWARELSDFNEIIMIDHNHSISRFSKYA